MSEIKLIAIDLDGTLLDTQKRLSSRNREVLEECIRRGILIVPCTGRIWAGVPEFLRDMPGIRYAITVNGAVIEDVEHQRVLDEQKLSVETAIEILELAKQFHTMYDIYAGGLAFAEARFMEHMDDYGILPELQEMIWNTRQIVPDIIEKFRMTRQPAEKINYFFGDMAERQRALEILLARRDIVVSSSFPTNIEINAPGATKGAALMKLAAHAGLRPEQTMGFGDGGNDLTMIRLAGIGVAMGNGIEEVKREADYVTLTNDQDGVAAAIEKFAL